MGELHLNLGSDLDAYAETFAGCFRRRDQARWARYYIQWLLSHGQCKNVETLARELVLDGDLAVGDPVQAMQNFVNQSPWDERLLWRRLRSLLAPTFDPSDGVLVIDDVYFPKQGLQSAGVQRQHCSRLGRKLNCQLAVGLFHVGAEGACPLALRLYLPRGWARDSERLQAAGVPVEQQAFRSRGEIALDLLDEVRAVGIGARDVVAAAGLGGSPELRLGLARRGLRFLAGVTADFLVDPTPSAPPAAPRMGMPLPTASLVPASFLARRLGLARKDGSAISTNGEVAWLPIRTPAPSAEELNLREDLRLLVDTRGTASYAVGSGNVRSREEEVAVLWRTRLIVEDLQARLANELGLTHFEGRSWRGFHHHACLVALAYGFLFLEGQAAQTTAAYLTRHGHEKRSEEDRRRQSTAEQPRFGCSAVI
ncbi:MAG: IS701 family transposase [Gemmataceae bacterium]|nr:IS701 family transposase [Gemmataceae bacterium]